MCTLHVCTVCKYGMGQRQSNLKRSWQTAALNWSGLLVQAWMKLGRICICSSIWKPNNPVQRPFQYISINKIRCIRLEGDASETVYVLPKHKLHDPEIPWQAGTWGTWLVACICPSQAGAMQVCAVSLSVQPFELGRLCSCKKAPSAWLSRYSGSGRFSKAKLARCAINEMMTLLVYD